MLATVSSDNRPSGLAPLLSCHGKGWQHLEDDVLQLLLFMAVLRFLVTTQTQDAESERRLMVAFGTHVLLADSQILHFTQSVRLQAPGAHLRRQ